jgi:hypothetical protein
MAIYQFKNFTVSDIGTTETVLYTPPTGQKSMLLGLTVTNTTPSSLPIELYIVKSDSTVVHLSKSTRVLGGESVDLLSGKKLVVVDGDSLKIKSKVASSFDVVLSVMEDVD